MYSRPPGAVLEGVDRVVRVLGRPAVDQVDHLVGLVVAVGILEEDQPRLVDHQHAAVPELEPGRAVELVVEGGALVGLAVARRCLRG